MPSIDFLAVGDITTDTFIKLAEASVQCDANNENCTLSMPWGDKIPYESATVVAGVGNAANAAVSAARLGLASGLLSSTGRDAGGDGNIAALVANRVSTALVTQVDGIPSNHDFVLSYESERTILIKHSAFPYAFPADLEPPRALYLSSLGDPSGKTHAALAAWAAAHPETKLFFQPGLEIAMGRELLAPVYAASFMCICNKEEAARILGIEETPDIALLARSLAALGPKIVVITDGLNGAYALDGARLLKVPLYPDPRPPRERTGAGDAFASTVAAALSLGKPLDEALLWGPVNSMSVVQRVGAQEGLLARGELEGLLAAAPAAYALASENI